MGTNGCEWMWEQNEKVYVILVCIKKIGFIY